MTGSLNGLGSQHRLGDTPGALRAFEEALQAKRRAGLDEDGALLNLASAHHDLGRPDRAAPLDLQALEGLIRRQFLNQIPAALLGLARLAVDQTQPGLAAQLIAAADTQARRVESVPLPDEQEERRALLSRVRALLDARDPAAATGAWATGSRWTPQDTLDEVIRIPFVSLTDRNTTDLPAPRPEGRFAPTRSARIERTLQPIQSESISDAPCNIPAGTSGHP
ncbi:tetratricopeptide repeat protein [Deinococcus sp.]|uniref:tetratricopeptide repeat protein n=1 Tax=Deinococcus sp. TaxID=47478 RepID=UPI00391D9939